MSTVVDKKIGAFEARRQFGQILKEVEVKGDRFVVERHGAPVAAVVPIAVYKQWKKTREAFFAKIRKTATSANISPEEAERLAHKAVGAVRSGVK